MVRPRLQRGRRVVIGEVRRGFGLARSFLVYWRPGRQRALRRLYEPFVSPGDVVFDVGAHLGDRTVAFADLGARVVALEPNPHLARWLRRVVRGRSRVLVLEEAAGAREGHASLALSDATPTLSTLSAPWRERIAGDNPTFRGVRWDRSVEVPVTTLDRLIARHGRPSFCKIDVEGFEPEVLAGLSEPLAALSVEFVAGCLGLAADCVRRLDELGSYRFNAAVGETRSFALPEWVEAPAILTWLEKGADGASSGDLYARHV